MTFYPFLRGDPNAIKKMEAEFSALWDLTLQPDLHEVNRAVLQAMWWFGVRPGELTGVKLGTQRGIMLAAREFPELSMPIRGKANNRRMFGGRNGGAYKFMEWWLEERKKFIHTDELAKEGLEDASQDVFFVNIKGQNQPATAANINIILKEAAQSYGPEGESLLNFYRQFDNVAEGAGKGNNNYAYVFRLAAASRWLKESRQSVGRSIQPIQMAMGHDSPFHTARYFSHTLHDHHTVYEAFEMFGFDPVLLNKWMGAGGGYTQKNAIGKFFSKLPAGPFNQEARADLQDVRAKFLLNNIAEVLDPNSASSPTLIAKVPEGILPETAKGIHKLEELQNLMYYIQDVIAEKGHITAFGQGTVEQQKTAREAIVVLKSWRQPIVDAATRVADEIVGAADLPKDALMPKEALRLHTGPFVLWQSVMNTEELSAKKFAGLGRGKGPSDFLSGKLPLEVIAAAEITPGGAAGQSIAARIARLSQPELDKLNQQLLVGDAILPAVKGAKKAVIKPGHKGLSWTNTGTKEVPIYQLSPKDARLGPGNFTGDIKLNAGYLVRQETKQVLGRATWIVSHWTMDAAGSYNGAVLRKLASKPTDPATGWKLRYSRFAEEIEVPITQLKEWRIINEAPISTDPTSDVFTSLIRPGRKKLSSDEIANYFFLSRKFDSDNNWVSMIRLRKQLSVVGDNQDLIDMGLDGLVVPDRRRLENSGLLDVKGKGNNKKYKWKDELEDGSETVEQALNRKITDNPSDEGWATAPRLNAENADIGPPRVPGGPAGNSRTPEEAGWPFSDGWNRMMFGEYGLHQILVVPYGMDQPGKIFSGGNFAKRLFSLLDEEKGVGPVNPLTGQQFFVSHGKQKYWRMLIPGTWGTSPGGRLQWTVRIAHDQVEDIVSTITHKLEESFANANILTDNWSGANIRLVDSAADPAIIDEFVRTKALTKKKVSTKDMTPAEIIVKEWEEAGQVSWPKVLRPSARRQAPGEAGEGTFRARSKNQGGDPRFYDPRTGRGIILAEPHPYNVTRHRLFHKFNYDDPVKWSPDVIKKDILNWTYEQNTQYVGTFLATPREVLSRYYVMTPQLQTAWDHYHEVQRQLAVMFEQTGHTLDEIMGELEWFDEFVPLLPTGKMSTDPFLGVVKPMLQKGKIGGKPTSFLDRKYTSHIQGKMMQGQVYGRTMHEVYNNNPMASLNRTITQTYDYIIEHQFLDAYVKLGLDESAKMTPNDVWYKIIGPYREKLISEGRKAADLTLEGQHNSALELAIKLFGSDWKDATPEVADRLRRTLGRYRSAIAASENLGLNQGLEYVVDKHAIKNIAFDIESSHELMALGSDMIDPVTGWLSTASAASNAMRVFATGADLGVLLLHGFGALGTMLSPNIAPRDWGDWSKGMQVPLKARAAWGKGAYYMGKAMKQQIIHGKGASANVRREWYINTTKEREEMRKYGVSFFRATFSEDLPTYEALPKIELGKGARRTKMAPVLQRVGDIITSPIDGFGFFLDVSKTEMWRAYKGMGVDSAADLSELAASLNAIHGTLSPHVSGIQYKQRVFESALVSYAAMYRRSALALLKNAMTPGKEAAWRRGPALNALSGMIFAGTAFGFAISELQDAGLIEFNDNLWNPGTPDFLAMKVGGMRFGISTPFYSFIRTGTAVINQMIDDPAGLKPTSITDNALLRWARSQTSPVTSIGVDLLQGADFINEPLHTPDGGWEINKIGERTLRTFVPFWIESAMHRDTRSFRGSLGELMGLRVSPISPYSKLMAARNLAIILSDDPDITKWRNSQNLKGLPVTGNSIPRLLLARLMEDSPALIQLEQEMSDQVQLRGSKSRKEQDSFITLVNENREEANKKLIGIQDDFAGGQMSGKVFRDAIKEVEIGLRAANRQVAGTHEAVIERFEERRSDRADREADYFVGDIVYDLYRETVTNASEMHDAYGNFNMEAFLIAQDSFAQKYAAYWPYVKERINENRQMPGLVGDFYRAKKTLKDYWDLADAIWGPNSWQVDMLNNWRSVQTHEGKELYRRQNYRISGLLSKLQYQQGRYRRSNPNIDKLLVQFYDYSPVTSLGRTVQKGRIAAAGVVS